MDVLPHIQNNVAQMPGVTNEHTLLCLTLFLFHFCLFLFTLLFCGKSLLIVWLLLHCLSFIEKMSVVTIIFIVAVILILVLSLRDIKRLSNFIIRHLHPQ